MFRWIVFWILFFIAGFTNSAATQDFDASNFENFTKDTMAASNIPGLAVVIFDDNGTVYEKAFGIADPNQTPVTLDTPFQLGSVSKSFAALVLVQLASEGQIELDAPVINYLPDFRTGDKDAWKAITIRHILSHRSGISTFDGNHKQRDVYRGTDALDIAISELRKTKLALKPGTQLQYSNANYMLAAAVIEAVTNQSYEAVMDERVFKPLGMKNSYVQIPLRESVKEATGFRQWFGIPKAHPFIPGRAMMAAGGVTSSARDLAIYMRAIAARDPRIVPAEFADDMVSPQGDETDLNGYGLGWMLTEIDNKKIVYHQGLNAGFAAQAAFMRGDRRGGVVLTNSSGALQADVPGVILRKSLDINPGPSRPTTGQHMLVWGLLATAIILFLSFILSTVRFTAYAKKAERVPMLRRVLPSLALFTLAYILAVIIPKSQGINLGGIKGFNPDIWLCLLMSAVIAIIWGMTRLVYPRRL